MPKCCDKAMIDQMKISQQYYRSKIDCQSSENGIMREALEKLAHLPVGAYDTLEGTIAVVHILAITALPALGTINQKD